MPGPEGLWVSIPRDERQRPQSPRVDSQVQESRFVPEYLQWLNWGWVIMSWVSNRLRDLDNRSIHLSVVHFHFNVELWARNRIMSCQMPRAVGNNILWRWFLLCNLSHSAALMFRILFPKGQRRRWCPRESNNPTASQSQDFYLHFWAWEWEKERCSGSYRQAVGFLVIKDDSISERPG